MLGVADGDDQAHGGIEVAEPAELFIVQPAEDAGRKPLRGGFGGDIRGEDADVDGAIVVPLHLGAESGGGDVRALRDHQHHGRVGGKFIHAHALRGLGCLHCGFPLAHGNVIGLAVAGRGCKTRGGKDRVQLLPFHLAGGIIAAAGLSLFCNFNKIHHFLLFIHDRAQGQALRPCGRTLFQYRRGKGACAAMGRGWPRSRKARLQGRPQRRRRYRYPLLN